MVEEWIFLNKKERTHFTYKRNRENLLKSDEDEKIEDKVLNEIEDLYKIKNKELIMFLKQKGYTQFPLWL